MKLLMFLVGIASLVSCNSNRNAAATEKFSMLPSFKMLLMDSSTVVDSDSISGNNKILILYFRPDCIQCQEETKNLIKNINVIKNTKILLITSSTLEELRSFYNDFNLVNYDQISVSKDYEFTFFKLFQPPGVPYTVIYNKERKLESVFMGKTDFQRILDHIRS